MKKEYRTVTRIQALKNFELISEKIYDYNDHVKALVTFHKEFPQLNDCICIAQTIDRIIYQEN